MVTRLFTTREPIQKMSAKKILLCGHTSFSARGLVAKLEAAGHTVVCFGRGPVARNGQVVTGPVDRIDENPHLEEPFDTLVNFLLLKDADVEANVDYVKALARFCDKRCVPHLIHISSISVYKSSPFTLTEESEVEEDPEKKGAYGSLKVATDTWLRQHPVPGTKLTLLRPGFILGEGLVDPIVGSGARLPSNHLLCLGNGSCEMPMFSRDLLHRTVERVLERFSRQGPEIFLLVNPRSPTRREFMQACCEEIGCGAGAIGLPVWLWRLAGAGGELVSRVIGQKQMKVYSKIDSICRYARFDSSRTQDLLGIDYGFDWREKLRSCFEFQDGPVVTPPGPAEGPSKTNIGRIVILGNGRIVKQRHLPSLAKLGLSQRVTRYDVRGYEEDGQRIHSIDTDPLPKEAAWIVATPGPVHQGAIGQLASVKGPVLIEKPLCYRSKELNDWLAFAENRIDPVLVCHNYRCKKNVRRMIDLLSRCNPGKLLSVSVLFQSPPVSQETAVWARDEVKARTLLMDYGLHFLDVACQFSGGPWDVKHVRHRRNVHGQTDWIHGAAASEDGCELTFDLRQGFLPRKARVEFVFQNYNAILGFFPDTFYVQMSPESFGHFGQAASDNMRETGWKVWEKLSGRLQDDSHQELFRGFLEAPSDSAVTVERLEPFYRMLMEIGDRVYGGKAGN